MNGIRKTSLFLMALLITAKQAISIGTPPAEYPSSITLKAGVMPSFAFRGFQEDLMDHLVHLALDDNVQLRFDKTEIQELYNPNLALLSPNCNETTEINGILYHCDDFDLIVGDFWTHPDRFEVVDFSPALLTSSFTAMKYTEKTKFPNTDVTTFHEAERAGVPVCVVKDSNGPKVLARDFPGVEIVQCTLDECLENLRNENCFLFATDEMELRYTQTQFTYFEVTGELRSRQLIAWPLSKSLNPTASFLLKKWIYASISDGRIDELYFEYFEKKLCPLGTAGVDCELPCDPDHGTSNAQGECICKSVRWRGVDCSIEVPQELNMIPPTIKAITYSMFGLNIFLVVLGTIWLYTHWNRPAVQYQQPFFLGLVLFGCFVSTTTILAMAQEDEGDGPVDACLAIPWLYSLGFSITFGALFAKIRRVYSIFAQGHERASTRGVNSVRRAGGLSFRSTLSTVGKVLLLDVVILALWTNIDPLRWKRTVTREDQFGFPLESEGYCTSEHWEVFLGAIILLHIVLCAIACYMCYAARGIPSRYSEHKYVSIAMVSNLQVFMIGVPVLVIARDDPAAHFFVRSAIVWMNDFVVLTLIFGNLMWTVHKTISDVPMTGNDKRQVTNAITKFERRGSMDTSNRKSVSGRSLGESDRSNKNSKSDRSAVCEESFLRSDIESGFDGGGNEGGGTEGTSSSLHPPKEKESQATVSELGMSEVEESGHDEAQPASKRWIPSSPTQAKSNIMNHYGPAIPIRGETIIEQESEAAVSELGMSEEFEESGHDEAQPASKTRWISSSPTQAKSKILNHYGPAIPIRGETVVDEPEEGKVELGGNQKPTISDSGAKSIVKTILVNVDKEKMGQRISDLSQSQLPSILELEFSDEEDNLAQKMSTALFAATKSEQAPVMPKRFQSEVEVPETYEL